MTAAIAPLPALPGSLTGDFELDVELEFIQVMSDWGYPHRLDPGETRKILARSRYLRESCGPECTAVPV